MKTLKMKVEGMMCEGCEKRIKNALEKITGVEKIEPDYQEGIVLVKVRDDITSHELSKKVEDIGFKVKEVKEM